VAHPGGVCRHRRAGRGLAEDSDLAPLVIAIKMLGDVSVPLLLFSLGVRMTDVNFSEWKVAGAAPCCARWPAWPSPTA
jgi:predicted permease